MKQQFILQKLIAFCLFVPSINFAEDPTKELIAIAPRLDEPGALTIHPPQNWQMANPEELSPRVKLMVVGKSQTHYPPSINIGTEPYKGTTRNYLLMVKRVNESLGSQWKDLGNIQTQSGKASLSQVDMNTEWGPVRLMHVILVKNRTVYVVTAGALKEEFSLYYREFFDAFKSIKLNPSVFELVGDPKQQRKLEQEYQKLIRKQEKITFDSNEFQEKYWDPFLSLLNSHYAHLGPDWKEKTIQKVHHDLTAKYK